VKYNLNIKDILIVVLVVIIILLKSCGGGNVEPVVITKTEIKYDTITNEITTYVPKLTTRIVREIDTITDSLYIVKHDTLYGDVFIDTAKILEDFFAQYVYQDTQDFDSVKFVINDTISKNQILSRGIEYTLVRPTIKITEKHFINRREFYVGLGIMGTPQRLSFVGPQFNYKDKKRNLFGLGIGIDSDLQPVLSVNFAWRIGK
jgi:hypothetical protein